MSTALSMLSSSLSSGVMIMPSAHSSITSSSSSNSSSDSRAASTGLNNSHIEATDLHPTMKEVAKKALARAKELNSKGYFSTYRGMSAANGVFNHIRTRLSHPVIYDRQKELSFISELPRLNSLKDVREKVAKAMEEIVLEYPDIDPDEDIYYKMQHKFHDATYQGELFSTSPFLLDRSPAESALSFASVNGSMTHPKESQCTEVLQKFLGWNRDIQGLLSRSKVQETNKLISDLSIDYVKLIQNEHRRRGNGVEYTGYGGMFAVLSVPKDLVFRPADSHPVYRSHRGGLPCNCFDESQNREIAESFETMVDPIICPKEKAPPQYRIIVTEEVRERMLSQVIDCAPAEITHNWQRDADAFVERVKELKVKIDKVKAKYFCRTAAISRLKDSLC